MLLILGGTTKPPPGCWFKLQVEAGREGKGAGALAAEWRGFSVSFCFEWAVWLDTGESYGMNGLYVSQLAHIFWECSIHLETSP